MKTAEEYYEEFLEEINKLYRPNVDDQQDITIKFIKQAQIDAIEETVKFVSENTRLKPVNTSSSIYWNPDNLDKQSILDCAEILKKQL